MRRRSTPDSNNPDDANTGRRKRKVLRPWQMAELPVVSEERIQQLAREGRRDGWSQPSKHKRESPPLRSTDREILDNLPTVREPASPSMIFFWRQDRIVYVMSSIHGVFAHGLAAHRHGSSVRYGVPAKDFDRISCVGIPERLLDGAVAATTRLLRPAYNRVNRRAALLDEIAQDERDRELLARLGVPIIGWRGMK